MCANFHIIKIFISYRNRNETEFFIPIIHSITYEEVERNYTSGYLVY